MSGDPQKGRFLSPSRLAVGKVIVKYKGRVIFRQYIPKKRKRFGIKIYKLCDETGYMYNITVYLGRDRQRTVQHLTATHATVSELTEKIQRRIFKRTAEISVLVTLSLMD